jgi:transposase
MLNRFVQDAQHIYLALGATDFRKQISGLVSLVKLQLSLDPFLESSVFIFCNKKKDSIKVLRYDRNGFVLANKKLLEKMKFQWPKDTDEVKEISIKQVEWLLQGLEIDQKKAHHHVKIESKNICF